MTTHGVVARADAIRVEVERLPTLQQAAKNAEAVTTRADQLEDLARGLRARVLQLQLFRERGLHPYIDAERATTLLTKTQSYRSDFEEDRMSIAADPEDSGMKWNYRDELRRLVNSIDRALEWEWQQYVDTLIPDGLDHQLELLSGAGVLEDQVVQMRALGQKLKEARALAPREAGAFIDVRNASEELAGLWQRLEGIPEEVREFLGAASTTGATLDALTPVVRSWLVENEFLDSVRLVLRRRA